ncbi:GNAT family N-acetyltransferase [Mangrovibacillus sp. Mu-81]|jgi:ribosomal protein S18 acetylase RimI-like enzyme|uniref:GNAT family N-acetyltransferase n=1 Tax=Mangrovibacillus sp. Mu-81 TaxID=3121478 RepID=UPI002FE4CF5B
MERNNIMIIPYDPTYTEQTVKMWRDSKYDAIGQEEIHSFQNQVYYLNHILPKEFHIEVALMDEEVVGLIAYNESEISQLYIHIGYQGNGIGIRLLNKAKDQSSGRLTLYTFEINTKARRFYEKHGFNIIGRGNENEENLPDILYEWRAEDHDSRQ